MTPELDDPKQRKAVAQEHWSALKGDWNASSTGSMGVGWEAHFLKKNNLFGALGFADEHEARKAANVGESTWYANIRLAESYEGITKAQFVKMKQANAKAASDLSDAQRKSSAWVKAAQTQSMEDFAAAVDQEMGEKARRSDGKERSTSYKLSVPESRKEVIQERVKEFAQEHGLPPEDAGRVIELALVEATEGPTLMGTITTAAQQAKEIRSYMQDSPDSAEEQLTKVKEFVDSLILLCKEGLEQASASQNHKQKVAA